MTPRVLELSHLFGQGGVHRSSRGDRGAHGGDRGGPVVVEPG
jgi:hypothetical protein